MGTVDRRFVMKVHTISRALRAESEHLGRGKVDAKGNAYMAFRNFGAGCIRVEAMFASIRFTRSEVISPP